MVIVGCPLTFLRQGQICVPMHLYGENVEKLFLCLHLPKAGVGHIVFRRDVMSVHVYVGVCVCHVRNQVQVYLQVWVQFYVC